MSRGSYPIPLGSVRNDGENNFSFKVSCPVNSSLLRGPSSFSWVFLSGLERNDGVLAKLVTNNLKKLLSPNKERSLATIVGIFR